MTKFEYLLSTEAKGYASSLGDPEIRDAIILGSYTLRYYSALF